MGTPTPHPDASVLLHRPAVRASASQWPMGLSELANQLASAAAPTEHARVATCWWESHGACH
eukprot:12139094-Alexandrium_andersonii.AAC.1